MSLSKLGKNLSDAKNIITIFDSLKNITEGSSFYGLKLIADSEQSMKKIFDNMGTDNAIKAFQKLGLQGDGLVKVLKKCGMETKDIDEKLDKLGTSGKSSESFITKLGNAFTGLMSKITPTVKGIALVTAALAAAGIAFIAYNDYVQESVAAAKQEGETWTSNNESLESYISRIRQFRTALDSGTLSEESAYNAKSELYSIQQQLINTYGDYAAGINILPMISSFSLS